ncbi:Tn3 family transposase [Pseudomonas aeruginosa]|jgi:hypothetical protein|nr:Tn3 family transposase [Pseudomonas aeruginosa]AVE21096.1 Hypothetical protein [Pseudomonas aeruginosa]QHU24625.1 Mobile element protein [Pseudomonas aeruginosa]QTK16399.1 hypothetical protein HUF04_05200 [Pseudomonas aeruginosa]
MKLGAYPVLEEDVARLSPLIYEHINILGRYVLCGTGRGRPRRAASAAQP